MWLPKRQEVWCLTTAKTANELFVTEFQRTFGEALDIQLIAIEPALLGLNDDHWRHPKNADDMIEQLTLATPALFDMPEGEATAVN